MDIIWFLIEINTFKFFLKKLLVCPRFRQMIKVKSDIEFVSGLNQKKT
jgi:hypothetical protein